MQDILCRTRCIINNKLITIIMSYLKYRCAGFRSDDAANQSETVGDEAMSFTQC